MKLSLFITILALLSTATLTAMVQIPSDPNCIATNPSNNFCTSCSPPFIPNRYKCICPVGSRTSDLDPTKCVAVIANCFSYTLDTCSVCSSAYKPDPVLGLCSTCNDGYRVSDLDILKCVKAFPNCLYTKDICSACLPAYKFEKFERENRCMKCNNGYHKSQITPGQCIADALNCASYTNDNCITCNRPYSVNPTSGECSNCAPNYRVSQLNSANCIAEVPKCLDYTLDKCNSCSPDTQLSTVTYRCFTPVTYCSKYEKDVCQSCMKGFYLVKTPTLKCQINPIPNCATYTLPTVSISAQDILQSLNSNQRSSNQKGSLPCATCNPGYQLDPIKFVCNIICPASTNLVKYVRIKGNCISVDINCLITNSQTGKCLKCNTGFKPKLNSCI